jgi:hypothetical protein
MKWFRWYRGASENPKFAMIATRANKPSDSGSDERVHGAVNLTDVLAVWCVLLEDAANKSHWGVCEKRADFIAVVLRWWPEEVQAVLDAMVEFGLLEHVDGGGLGISKWSEYQYASDSDPTNAERQRRYYNAHKTANKHEPNALAKRPDTDTESDTEEENNSSIDDEFGVWYAAYPRKQGRGQAIKAYRQARKKADAAVLLAGIERYKKLKPAYADWRMPATWLNGEGWLDQPDAKANGTAPELSGDALWRWRVEGYVKRKFWKPDWGSLPGPGCDAPASILQEFGLSA